MSKKPVSKIYPSGGGSLTGVTGQSGSILTRTGTSAKWVQPYSSTIKLAINDDEMIELTGSDLLDIKLLLEAIKEIPNDHPLADLKRDFQVKRAVHTLSQGDAE